MNSRAKGKRGELEFAHYLQGHGYEARRGQQFSGGGDSPDVVTSVAGVHFEVKRKEAGNPYLWVEQAKADAATGKVPLVAHRRNGQDWLAILPMDDMIAILKELRDLRTDYDNLVIAHADLIERDI